MTRRSDHEPSTKAGKIRNQRRSGMLANFNHNKDIYDFVDQCVARGYLTADHANIVIDRNTRNDMIAQILFFNDTLRGGLVNNGIQISGGKSHPPKLFTEEVAASNLVNQVMDLAEKFYTAGELTRNQLKSIYEITEKKTSNDVILVKLMAKQIVNFNPSLRVQVDTFLGAMKGNEGLSLP